MELNDMMEELATALDNHRESGGHEFSMNAFDAFSGYGEIRVTAPDGTQAQFQVRLRHLPATK